MTKFAEARPYADPDAAARKLHDLRGSPAEYGAGIDRAIANGWLSMHESGTFVRFTQTGADLFA
jgi:hypothetical protein